MAVTLCDVGPRDGLQNEPETLAPGVRAELVNRLAAAGLPRIEAVSFVRDDRVPQMAGAEEVVAAIERREGTEYSGLVLNERGYERFARVGARPRQRHVRRDRELQPRERQRVARRGDRARGGDPRARRGAGDGDDLGVLRLPVRGACRPGRGRRARGALHRSRRGRARGHDRRRDAVARAGLVDATGAEGFHGHNTRNTGYANCLAALEAGASVLDASVGGLGGCPYRAARDRQRRDGGSRLPARGRRRRDGRRPRRAHRRVDVARKLLGRALAGYVYRAGLAVPASTLAHERCDLACVESCLGERSRRCARRARRRWGGSARSPSTVRGGETVVPSPSCWRIPSACVCSCANASPTSRTGDAGTPAAASARLPLGARPRAQALRRAARRAPSRLRTRSGFVRKRSSSGSSSTPRSRS